jgi:hypothetical protein
MHTSFSGATLETRVWRFACIVLLLGGFGIVAATVSYAIRFLGKDPIALLMLGAAIGWAGAIGRWFTYASVATGRTVHVDSEVSNGYHREQYTL